MDLVDEQDVVVLHLRQERGQIAGLSDHRARRRSEVHAELARHDLRQGRLAESRRADEQDVVQRLAGPFRASIQSWSWPRAAFWPLKSARRWDG